MIQFWRDHVLENRPGCLYISGSPGTGKTALMKDVIQQMEVENSALKTHKVKVVVINCMTVREPKGIYSKLVEQLKTARQTISNDVVKQAEQLLNNKKNVINVVLLDEIDHLITKDQDVLYKIFEWASMASSRLVLIGIANALDLTDRLLPRLRAKNCEPQLLNFNPYQVSEIVAILKDRLYSVTDTPTDTSVPPPLIQPAALELCARKVAASMGDLRTALDICRHAIELAENETKTKPKALGEHNVNGTLRTNEVPKVSISHVMKVLQCVFGNPTVQKLKTLNLQQKVVIGVLMVMGRKKIQLTMGKVCNFFCGYRYLRTREVTEI
ncbi:P-loop containing nucleoside triphosphate hydrolase protein [Radiomyces spectabilis]|uniref:P-loop containing nucleoside triphosphate hydrolase protein n=1 Tax=Radiomyces spectabilis TaxID=64574 RepID=UPI00221ECF39|nr:P-loop containing nucleoside triphosphate hydrolase protein [Radiomyces spectabilis]KAI8377780.1 P-loop containing nucleoside triphosphate hydrolase protein [Radiomyces spectabilis]